MGEFGLLEGRGEWAVLPELILPPLGGECNSHSHHPSHATPLTTPVHTANFSHHLLNLCVIPHHFFTLSVHRFGRDCCCCRVKTPRSSRQRKPASPARSYPSYCLATYLLLFLNCKKWPVDCE